MEKSEIRSPAVSGTFYPSSKEGIETLIKGFGIETPKKKLDALAIILPHAGYVYSGRVAAETAAAVNIRKKIVLLGPNHTGEGSPASIMAQGTWQTPLGPVNIDSKLAREILTKSQFLKEDSLAHRREHSLEVELPILKFFHPDFEIVPICLAVNDPNVLKQLGQSIAEAIKETGASDVLIVASSDMTHYEPQSQAVKKDNQTIQAILNLDDDLLLERVDSLNISMCGYAPVACMLSAVKLLGAKSAKLIKYQTSAAVTGDERAVVGYAGIAIY